MAAKHEDQNTLHDMSQILRMYISQVSFLDNERLSAFGGLRLAMLASEASFH